ncbi:hypothetical protein DN614_24440 [Klebsiella michiganensis]|uniref:hypothetical protein n=1 Tax=Klebsiella TaxID=570 RepID=UPI000FEBD421|nr:MULTISPECIES: hypothetical protein [Klebsiella]MBD0905731.1 hypothetical protein [Klebsiella grimontii]MDH0489760.1 hypothetical protein [Klebsiella michiganensis]RWS81036.1 hypothetical protein DN614_24440 [Klebsiella michiganensis]
MIESIVTGKSTTPTALAKELVFTYGEYVVSDFNACIVGHKVALTAREIDIVKSHVLTIIERSAKMMNCDSVTFNREMAKKEIGLTK